MGSEHRHTSITGNRYIVCRRLTILGRISEIKHSQLPQYSPSNFCLGVLSNIQGGRVLRERKPIVSNRFLTGTILVPSFLYICHAIAIIYRSSDSSALVLIILLPGSQRLLSICPHNQKSGCREDTEHTKKLTRLPSVFCHALYAHS